MKTEDNGIEMICDARLFSLEAEVEISIMKRNLMKHILECKKRCARLRQEAEQKAITIEEEICWTQESQEPDTPEE